MRSFFNPLMAMPLVVLSILVVILVSRPVDAHGFPVAAAFALPLLLLVSGLILTVRTERFGRATAPKASLRRPR